MDFFNIFKKYRNLAKQSSIIFYKSESRFKVKFTYGKIIFVIIIVSYFFLFIKQYEKFQEHLNSADFFQEEKLD